MLNIIIVLPPFKGGEVIINFPHISGVQSTMHIYLYVQV